MSQEAKGACLRRLSMESGVIAALAMDQRKSLRQMIARAAGVAPEGISDAQLAEFKGAVTRALTPHASAVLLDPDYGLDAARLKAQSCGLLLTYEMDGYENPRPHRMLGLLPRCSVLRLKELGADGIKILLSYDPEGNAGANDEKKALIERIGAECESVGVPFFLEPVVYDEAGADVRSAEFARRKPELVIRTMAEFSQPRYKVEVLKVEFPVGASRVGEVFTRAEALAHFRKADEAAGGVPYIYLSAGVSITEFVASLRLAAESGAGFRGVLCGRANWQDGVPAYAHGGLAALEDWLARDGVKNIQAVNECLPSA